jgi:3,4-dihydroxy 2-butanone 4-phosphate synthase/GTP cyclohydrolase II
MIPYRDRFGHEHLAVIKGCPVGDGVLCRVHSECLTGEVFRSLRCDCGPQLDLALREIKLAGEGVVLYLRQEGRGIGLYNKLEAYALQEQGVDTVDANLALGFAGDLRTYDIAAEILGDLGIRSVMLMSNNPAKVDGLRKAGVGVVRRIDHIVGHNEVNRHYLETKKQRMGHLFEVGATEAIEG